MSRGNKRPTQAARSTLVAEPFATLSDKELLIIVSERRCVQSGASLALADAEVIERGGFGALKRRAEAKNGQSPWLAKGVSCLKCGSRVGLNVRERQTKRFLCPACDTAQDWNDASEMANRLIGLHAPFNFGSCFLAPLWAMAHGLSVAGLALIVLTFVALVVRWETVTGIVALAIVSGFFGNRIAWRRCNYVSIDELLEKERTWNAAGLTIAALLFLLLMSLWLKSL
ncbi:MAG: hypothetical protein HY961_07320 [Ignavibacteriae bacterium]|nr:hypothetical protein [Ignavibacteriota bacterium]